MIKICEECKKHFDTKSPSPKQCPECREKLLTRVCEICGTVFKARKPNEVRPTCGKQECINASISRKFTPERKKAQGARLAQRNRDTYNSMTEDERAQVTERIMNWNRNATPVEKLGIKLFHLWENDVESGLEEFYIHLKSLSKF